MTEERKRQIEREFLSLDHDSETAFIVWAAGLTDEEREWIELRKVEMAKAVDAFQQSMEYIVPIFTEAVNKLFKSVTSIMEAVDAWYRKQPPQKQLVFKALSEEDDHKN